MPFDLIVSKTKRARESNDGERTRKRERGSKIVFFLLLTALFADLFPLSPPSPLPPTQKQQQSGVFVPEKSNIWRDCVDGYYDWVKEHIAEVRERE